ncbi:MAG TPA: hypothetical protein PK179_06690 [Spirochaetales bacterium]|nr:hypothetical protein [Spirochaetales bacterium]
MRRMLLAASAACILGASCASLGDPFLVAFGVDSAYQSEALTASGIDEYRERLLGQGDVAAAASIQRLFEAALRYDPNNAEAARYLALVEDFRASRFSSSMAKAEGLLAKPKRNPDDEYAMLLAVRRALDIYPQDDDAKKLHRSTADVRAAFVSARLTEAEAIRVGASDADDAKKERAYIQAFNLIARATDVEPRDVEGTRAYRQLRSDIAHIVEKRLGSVDGLSAKGRFDEAESVLAVVKELDAKIGRTFSSDIGKAEYSLYLAWARYHESRKEWTKAEARVRKALAIQKGADAVALQKRIKDAVAAEERGASFEAGLKNLDAYIAKGDLTRAQRLVASLSKGAATSSERGALDQRRTKIRSALPPIYESGLKAYREERFKEAVAAFEVVVAVDPAYEDAAGYLEKARDKQKLLDQY